MLSQRTKLLLKELSRAVGLEYAEPSHKLTRPKRIEALEQDIAELKEMVETLQQKRGPGRPRKEAA